MKNKQQEQEWLKKIYEKCESVGVSKSVIKQFESYYLNKKEGAR